MDILWPNWSENILFEPSCCWSTFI
jgi:hypothetical protein